MKTTLQLQLLLFICLLLSFNLSAQIQKYHRIEANIPQDKFQELMQAGLDIDHYHYHDGHLIAEVSEYDIQLFKDKKIRVKYLIKDLEKNYAAQNAKMDKMNRFNEKTRAVTVPTPVNFGNGGSYGSGTGARHFTYQEMQAEMDQMRALYPNLVSVRSSIGNSIEGRTLDMIKISDNPDVDEAEPEVFLNAVHHAREPISMTQLIFFMWYVLENYNSSKEIQHLLNSTELYAVPCVNPDGYVYNYSVNSAGGSMWRKNRRLNSGGSYGVDNNRNYSYGWGGSGASATQTSDTYRGTAAFSEPENQAVRSFCNSRQFVSAFNYHAYGNYCIYPYSNVAVNNNPEIPLFNQLSVFLTEDNAFTYGNAQATVAYIASGGAEDWAYAEQTTKGKMYGFTPEIGNSTDGFYPASSRIIPLCNSMIVMNTNLLKVSTKFSKVTTTQSSTMSSLNGTVPFNIKNFSLLASTYTVTLTPLSLFVTAVDPAKTFSSIPIFQTQNDVFNFTLDPSIPTGTSISFEVSNNNGMNAIKDTITIVYTCAAPTGTSTSSITTSSATANWSALAGSANYYFSYKQATATTWSADILVSSTNASMTGLNANTAYSWRVRGDNCANYSNAQNFTTLQICGTPAASASGFTSSSFNISWPAIASATTYNVQWRQQGTGVWTSSNVSSASFNVTGLAASTIYEFQVNATCPSGTSPYSSVGSATTLPITTISYCSSNGNNTSFEWIDFVGLGTIARTSAQEAGGYVNTSLSTNLIKGTAYTITFSAGFASTIYREYWRVYIDYNGDGDFVDAGENVVNTNKTGAGNYTASFTVPTTATATTTRMRVKMSYNTISSPCGAFTYGEVEDYNVSLTTSASNKSINEMVETTETSLNALIMPNPFKEIISIQLETNTDQNTTIDLFDLNGKIVYSHKLPAEELSHRIMTADLPSGMYLLVIQQGDKRKTFKLMK